MVSWDNRMLASRLAEVPGWGVDGSAGVHCRRWPLPLGPFPPRNVSLMGGCCPGGCRFEWGVKEFLD
jgi:hypothetical protein